MMTTRRSVPGVLALLAGLLAAAATLVEAGEDSPRAMLTALHEAMAAYPVLARAR